MQAMNSGRVPQSHHGAVALDVTHLLGAFGNVAKNGRRDREDVRADQA